MPTVDSGHLWTRLIKLLGCPIVSSFCMEKVLGPTQMTPASVQLVKPLSLCDSCA